MTRQAERQRLEAGHAEAERRACSLEADVQRLHRELEASTSREHALEQDVERMAHIMDRWGTV